LAAEVHSVEIIPELERTARERLERLGCRNVYTHVGNGEQGWPEAAPYDAILLTAAPAQVPPALFTQLKPGRRLVAPVGATGSQVLMVYTKTEKGQIDRERIFEVRFVPLLGRLALSATAGISAKSEDRMTTRKQRATPAQATVPRLRVETFFSPGGRAEVPAERRRALRRLARETLQEVARRILAPGPRALAVAVQVAGAVEIRALNRERRRIDRATDTLSFPQREPRGAARILARRAAGLFRRAHAPQKA
jgi:hypothetical protein